MILKASINTAKSPFELTVTLDDELAALRTIEADVFLLGQAVKITGVADPVVTDAERKWSKKSDDGKVIVYTAG